MGKPTSSSPALPQAEIRVADTPGDLRLVDLVFLEQFHASLGLELHSASGSHVLHVDGDRGALVTSLLQLARFALLIREAAVQLPGTPAAELVNQIAAEVDAR